MFLTVEPYLPNKAFRINLKGIPEEPEDNQNHEFYEPVKFEEDPSDEKSASNTTQESP